MAADASDTGGTGGTGGTGDSGFGQVSRRAGIVFRYAILAATLTGLVVLAALLLYVANDAFQPFTADAGWHVTYLLTLVAPTLATGAWLYRRSYSALTTGLLAFFLPAVSLLYAGGLAAIFLDVIPTLVWLSFVVAFAVPALLVVALRRVDTRLPFLARVGSVVAVGAASLLVVPGVVQGLTTVPSDWLVMALTLGVPEAYLVAKYAERWGGRAPLVAGAATVAAAVAGAFVGAAVGVGQLPGVIMTVMAGVPTAVYAATVLRERPVQRPGLALPVVVVAGAVVGTVVVSTLGFTGPDSYVDWSFLTSVVQSGDPDEVGIYPGIVGTVLIMIVVGVLSFPVGVGAAIYLEEYAPDNTVTRIIDININNLSGVPSVVYGLLGLGLFIRYGGMNSGTLIVAGATLALLILPIIIISAREAIRSVPDSLRQASYGMGATRWQTTRDVVLPRALPGILTGTILALSRAIGETAPLLVIGAAQVFGVPDSWNSTIGAMPLQLYVWASTYASPKFYTTVLAAGIVVLLSAMLTMNSIAIVVRNRFQQ
ncbi:phosphate ABC transporter permease PstA [Halobaculum sp. D14]|uniref:phosphate ABC transporter permease PstA n=1 Tax=unclassified Halobaculum TaxID=2640896 RepID=UPI003EBC3E6B